MYLRLILLFSSSVNKVTTKKANVSVQCDTMWKVKKSHWTTTTNKLHQALICGLCVLRVFTQRGHYAITTDDGTHCREWYKICRFVSCIFSHGRQMAKQMIKVQLEQLNRYAVKVKRHEFYLGQTETAGTVQKILRVEDVRLSSRSPAGFDLQTEE